MTLDQWQYHIERQAQSGQTQREYCNAQQLALSTFQYWKRRLRRQPDKHLPMLAPVRLSNSGVNYELELTTGRRIKIGGSFDEQIIRCLVQLLESV